MTPPPDNQVPSPASPANPLQPVLFEVKRTIVGQDVLLERMAIALISGGHLLVEGVPGLAKTLSVKSLAAAVGGQFQRIQFTPDLVPADLTGTRVFHQHTGEFQTQLGPVFTNLLLAGWRGWALCRRRGHRAPSCWAAAIIGHICGPFPGPFPPGPPSTAPMGTANPMPANASLPSGSASETTMPMM